MIGFDAVHNAALLSDAGALAAEFKERAAVFDREGQFPVDNLRRLRETSILGLLVPKEFGGMGGDLPQLVDVAETLAGGCVSTAMIWVMHCQQVSAIVNFGSAQLRAALLPRIAAGDAYIASVTSERGTGGNLLVGVDPLVPSDDGWQVARDAPIVTGAGQADGFLVTMRADDAASENIVTLVYLDRADVEVVQYGTWDPMGLRAAASPGIKLAGTVKPYCVIGRPGGFRDIATTCFVPVGHLGWAACWIGAAKAAFKGTVGLYGKPDAPSNFDVKSELFTYKLGRIRVDLELAAAYARSVLSEVLALRNSVTFQLQDPSTQVHLNTLKIAASELAFKVADQLIDLVGLRHGYQRDAPVPIERTFRDLRSASLNYHNDRLLTATGRLCLLDRSVRLDSL